jgi:hypothetical protein
MVATLLDWSCDIFCLVFGFSKSLLLELGGIVGLRVGIGQFASVELRELGLTIAIPPLPTINLFFA